MELQQLDEGGAKLAAGHDLVHKAVFQLELAALEALGQALADGLLDDCLLYTSGVHGAAQLFIGDRAAGQSSAGGDQLQTVHARFASPI